MISLIQDVEDKLVRFGSNFRGSRRIGRYGFSQAGGSAVPGIIRDDQVSGQDDVDDLLSSLGFKVLWDSYGNRRLKKLTLFG